MSADILAVCAIIAAICSVVATVGALVKFGGRISAVENNAKSALDDAAAAIRKAEALARDLNDHRVSTEGRISETAALVRASREAFLSAEQRLVKAIDDLGLRFDRMAETFHTYMSASKGGRHEVK